MESTAHVAKRAMLLVLVISVCSLTDASNYNNDYRYSHSKYFPSNYYKGSSNHYKEYSSYPNNNREEPAPAEPVLYKFNYNESDEAMKVFGDHFDNECSYEQDVVVADIVLSVNPTFVVFYVGGLTCAQYRAASSRSLYSIWSSDILRRGHFFIPDESSGIANLMANHVLEKCPELKGVASVGMFRHLPEEEGGDTFDLTIIMCLTKSLGFM